MSIAPVKREVKKVPVHRGHHTILQSHWLAKKALLA